LNSGYLCSPLKKVGSSSTNQLVISQNFFSKIEKNFAEIKRPLTFAPQSKNWVAVMPKDL
jgi:hypothetical protein